MVRPYIYLKPPYNYVQNIYSTKYLLNIDIKYTIMEIRLFCNIYIVRINHFDKAMLVLYMRISQFTHMAILNEYDL